MAEEPGDGERDGLHTDAKTAQSVQKVAAAGEVEKPATPVTTPTPAPPATPSPPANIVGLIWALLGLAPKAVAAIGAWWKRPGGAWGKSFAVISLILLTTAGLGAAALHFKIISIGQLAVDAVAKPIPSGDPKLAEAIAEAEKRSRPYVVVSISEVVHLRFDRTLNQRTADFTVAYTLLFLKDVAAEDSVFKEEFQSASRNARFLHVYGTQPELLPGEGATYDVGLSGKKGELRTVITGGRYIHALPYPRRGALHEKLMLNANDDTWNYPNSEDVIRELSLLIISDDPDFRPLGNAAAHRSDQKKMLKSVSAGGKLRDDKTNMSSIAGRWENVMPGEEVAIAFTWEPTLR